MNYKEIIKMISKKNFWIRMLLGSIAIFVLALNYNVFMLHNDIVVGGTSGLSIIFSKVLSIPPATFILLFNLFFVLISFLLLGTEQTSRTILGSILYPLFVELTIPLANFIIPHVNFESMFLTILITALLYGTCNGIIYKSGYTTGGIDILIQIFNKYLHISSGKASMTINAIIVGTGAMIFGFTKALYAIIVIIINSILVDKILIGISDSKMFFIYTKKEKEVTGFIINEINAGYTVLTTEGGYTKSKRKMIMCVVPTKDYYLFKESVLAIDNDAFFVISDCYEVSGGFKRSNLPFI